MLKVIADIGKNVSNMGKKNNLDYFISERNDYKLLVGFNFNTNNKNIEISLLKDAKQGSLSNNVLKEFVFLPSEKGNRPQFVVTTPNLNYLLSQTIPNLQNFLEEGELKSKLACLIELFWIEKKAKKKFHKFIINPIFFKNFSVIYNENEADAKKALKQFSKDLSKAIADKMLAKSKEILYTVLIDGEPIAKDKEYQDFILNKNLESAFASQLKKICSCCGKETEVTTDTTRLQFKFYMTDKINFASYFDDKNFYRAVTLCKNCYRDVVIGERWIDANLRTSIGNFQVYLLPQILYSSGNDDEIFSYLKQVTSNFNTAKNISELREKEKEVIRFFGELPFIFNFLFYRKAQSAFKVLTLIKDVPPSRIMKIAKITNRVDDIAGELEFPTSARFDLNQIYWLTPLKKKGAEHVEYRKLLQFFDNLFSGYAFDPPSLYNVYSQLAHIHHTETYNLYQMSKQGNPDWALKNDTLKWNLFILFLKKLDLFNGGESMEANRLKEYFPSGISEIFTELQYSQAQQGLALLGYVLGAVANAQYKEGLENKPVLEKVNYQGMSEEKILRLFNELFEKVRQYRNHIGYAERWWSAAKQLYESADRSNLSANERVFYLLSGYSFHLLGAGKKEESENNNNKNQEE